MSIQCIEVCSSVSIAAIFQLFFHFHFHLVYCNLLQCYLESHSNEPWSNSFEIACRASKFGICCFRILRLIPSRRSIGNGGNCRAWCCCQDSFPINQFRFMSFYHSFIRILLYIYVIKKYYNIFYFFLPTKS